MRQTLAWYPEQLWRWLLACQWHRIAQEEAFVARTAEVGDETGSAVSAARLVRDVMRLALLLDRRYPPYQKWLGAAFAAAAGHGRYDDDLPGNLAAAVHAGDVAAREDALGEAYRALGRRHNAAGLTEPLDPALRNYHGRPARVLMADCFTDALLDSVSDPALHALPRIGNVDQAVDSTDLLSHPQQYRRLSQLHPGVAKTGRALT